MTAFFASAIMAVPAVFVFASIVPNLTAELYVIVYAVLAVFFLPMTRHFFEQEVIHEE